MHGILEMFSGLQWAFKGLEDKAGLEECQVTFDGFDCNSESDLQDAP